MKRDNSIKHLRGPRKTKISFRGYDKASSVKRKETNQYSYFGPVWIGLVDILPIGISTFAVI